MKTPANNALLGLDNDATDFFKSGTANSASGSIMALANDSTFSGANINVALTERIFGITDPTNLEQLINNIVPAVPVADSVSKKFNFLSYTEKGQFTDYSVGDRDLRPRDGEFALVKFDGTDTDSRLYNKGLQIIIDDDAGGEDPIVQERYALFLRNLILRAELVRAVKVIDDNATTATAIGSSGTVTWSSGTSATPDTDLANLINASGNARGVDANRVLIGQGDWLNRMGACQRSTNLGVAQTAMWTPEQVASALGLDSLVRTKLRKQTATSTKAQVVTGYAYAYLASDNAVKEDPSNVKRFVGSSGLQVYTERLIKRTRIAVSHYSNIVCTNTLGISKIVIA